MYALTVASEIFGKDFRIEFLEILYPIIHFLGSSNSKVVYLASDSLNQIATNTGYLSARELIKENSDYLINAIGLKLNIFDISPSLLASIVMIIKFGGAQILPVMEDLIESLFVTIDNYHGYPKLMEGVFQALTAIVEEINATPEYSQRLIEQQGQAESQSRQQIMMNIDNKNEQERLLIEELKRPFIETPLQSSNNTVAKDSEKRDHVPLPPKSRRLVSEMIKKVVRLLSHPSDSVRYRLLELLLETNPLLALPENANPVEPGNNPADQDSNLLPLVHALWPSLVSRLVQDPVLANQNMTLRVLSQLIFLCGDFISDRFYKDAWPPVKRILIKDLESRKSFRPAAADEPVYGVIASAILYCQSRILFVDELLEILRGCKVGGGVNLITQALEKRLPDILWLEQNRGHTFKHDQSRFKFVVIVL